MSEQRNREYYAEGYIQLSSRKKHTPLLSLSLLLLQSTVLKVFSQTLMTRF